jgi:hypothetical protein
VNRVALKLTKLWLRLQGNRLLSVSTIELPEGKKAQVVVFSGNTYEMVGQVTPWGTILIHEFALLSKKLHDYVVAHESAHKRQWFRHFVYPLMMLWLILPASFLLFVLTTAQAAVTGDPVYLRIGVTTFIVSVVLFTIPVLFSWTLEFLADCYAIRMVGMPNVLAAIEEGRALANERGYKKPSRASKVLVRLTHPPLSLTYRICRLLHRNEIASLGK